MNVEGIWQQTPKSRCFDRTDFHDTVRSFDNDPIHPHTRVELSRPAEGWQPVSLCARRPKITIAQIGVDMAQIGLRLK